jgi:dynein heavy chain
MANPANFMNTLLGFKDKIDADMVPANNFKAIRGALSDPNFTPEIIKGKSSAAGGLCDWIINITAYYDVFVSVEPKKLAVKAANLRLSDANEKKAELDALVAKLTAELKIL